MGYLIKLSAILVAISLLNAKTIWPSCGAPAHLIGEGGERGVIDPLFVN